MTLIIESERHAQELARQGVLLASCTESERATVPHELYCTQCQTVLSRVPVGGLIFHNAHELHTGEAFCDCSWNCCAHARPGNRPHMPHLAYRPVKP